MENAVFLKNYTDDCAARVKCTDFDALGEIAEILLASKKAGASIFTAGNGGSAATASHFCNDLIKGCRVGGQPGFRAECLGDSLAVVTCLANDFSYEDIYRIQLETKAHAGDILIGFSGSGNSGNVVEAAETAREMGMTVIGFLGRDGGKLKPLCHRYVIAPTDSMEQLEDMHMLYCHALSCLLQKRLAE